MIYKRKAVIVSMGMAVTFLFAFSLWAQEPQAEEARAKRHEAMMQKMTQELGLSAQQQEQLKSLHGQRAGQSKQLRQNLQKTRSQLKDELDKQTIDKAAVDRLAADLKQLEAKMIDERIQRVVELRQVLTPEQYKLFQEKVKSRRDQFKEKFRERMQKHNGAR